LGRLLFQRPLKGNKREEALDRIALGINEGVRNCSIAINNINIIVQNLDTFSNPSELINGWLERLFSNRFENIDKDEIIDENDIIDDDNISRNLISSQQIHNLEGAFFNYLVGLIPIYYENRKIKSNWFGKSKTYKWTKEDFKQLKIKVLHRRFYSEWDKWDFETRFKKGAEIEDQMEKVLKIIANSSRANSSFFNKKKKINSIVSTEDLESIVSKIRPEYLSEYQVDLFHKYSYDFIKGIPNAYDSFDNNFYEIGFLYKFFQWNN
jgi:hypothetical protein